MSLVRLIAIARKEVRQLVRDWRILFILVFLPALLLLVFGYALSFDVQNVPLAVLDRDHTPQSREVVQSMIGSDSFELVQVIEREEDGARLLDGAKVDVVLVIPPGFGRDVVAGRPAQVQAMIDGSNSQSGGIVLGYLNAHVAAYASGVVAQVAERAGLRIPAAPIEAVPRVWYNPQLKSSMFLVPGLMVFVLMVSGTISTALSVVREKERNTVEQLLVSPVKAPELILGKTLPYLFVTMVAAVLLVAVGWVLFGVAVRGSLWLLSFASLIFCLCALGQGLLISSVTSSQQIAFFAAIITTLLPTFILSGFIFPLESTAVGIQVISHVVPARYFLSVARAVMLRGADIVDVWRPLASLSIYAVVILALASVRASRIRI